MKIAVAAPVSATALLASSLILAAPSYADDSAVFGQQAHIAICNMVGQEPTPHGIWAANSVLLTEQGSFDLNYGQMQKAIGYAIANYCPQYKDIYATYRQTYP